MKIRTGIALLGFGVTVGAVAIAACSSDSTTSGGGAVPPARPSGPAVTGTTARTFAIDSLKLGGGNSGNDWKTLGYNLDGKISVKGAKDVCTPVDSAPPNVHADGTGGIDNSFGQIIVPTLLQAAPDAEKTLNDNLKSGVFTIMFQANGLPADGATGTGIKGSIFAGGDNSAAGANPFGLDKQWPVSRALLVDGQTVAGGSKVVFSNAYMANGVFVTSQPADKTTISLSLSIGGQELQLSILSAVVTFTPKGTAASSGIIAGVISSAQLVDGIKKIAGRLSPQACSGTLLATIIDAVTGASDMNSDGTSTAGKTCDAISIGLGFTAQEIANPTTVAPVAPETPDPCAKGDAGTPDSGSHDSGSTADAGTDAK